MNPVFKQIVEKNIKNFKYTREDGIIPYLSNYAYLPMNVAIDSFLNIFDFINHKKYNENCDTFLNNETNYYLGKVTDSNSLYNGQYCLITPEKKAYILSENAGFNDSIIDLTQIDIKNDMAVNRIIKNALKHPKDIKEVFNILDSEPSLSENSMIEKLKIKYEKNFLEETLKPEKEVKKSSLKNKI
jgi:hypothetical protein